jgi:Nicotinate-nucleotide pyrophosphorylase
MRSLVTHSLVQLALMEDIGNGDITTEALVNPNDMGGC